MAIDGLFVDGAIFGAGAVGVTATARNEMLLAANAIKKNYTEVIIGKSYDLLTGATKARQQQIAKQIIENNLLKDADNVFSGSISNQRLQQLYKDAAMVSTKNGTSNEVILGKYIVGSSQSYDEIAKSRGSTYFTMSDWDSVQSQIGEQGIWNMEY